jgi:hypothetical protein
VASFLIMYSITINIFCGNFLKFLPIESIMVLGSQEIPPFSLFLFFSFLFGNFSLYSESHTHGNQAAELSFEMIFAGAIEIRHRRSKESVDAVQRQFKKCVAHRITGSDDLTANGAQRLTRSGVVQRQVSEEAPEKMVVNGEA